MCITSPIVRSFACRSNGQSGPQTTMVFRGTRTRRASVPGQEHLPLSLLRLSVGIEAVEDLWTDLDKALRKLPT